MELEFEDLDKNRLDSLVYEFYKMGCENVEIKSYFSYGDVYYDLTVVLEDE